MRKMAVYAMAALLAGLGGMAALPVSVQAQDLELDIDRDGPRLRLRDECDPRYERCRDEYRRGREERRYCTQYQALDKAERMGIRRARITSSDRRVIEVRGRDRYGERVRILFGRERGCPVFR